MRKPAEWMQPVDERILEILQEEGNLQPATIRDVMAERALDLDYTPEHVGFRCRELHEHGLLNRFGRGVYSITEDGERFLAGDLDAGELDDQSSNTGS